MSLSLAVSTLLTGYSVGRLKTLRIIGSRTEMGCKTGRKPSLRSLLIRPPPAIGECELPRWAELHHQDVLPLYGTSPLPSKGLHGRIRIVPGTLNHASTWRTCGPGGETRDRFKFVGCYRGRGTILHDWILTVKCGLLSHLGRDAVTPHTRTERDISRRLVGRNRMNYVPGDS